MKMKSRKMITLTSFGREYNRVVTNLRMLGKALMLFKGLNTLKVRKDFNYSFDKVNSTILYTYYNCVAYPDSAIKKSKTFQKSLR